MPIYIIMKKSAKCKWKDTEPNVMGPAENMDAEYKRPPQSIVNKARQKRILQGNRKVRKLQHKEIRMVQQKTRQAVLFLRHYDTNQVEMFTTRYKDAVINGHNNF